MALSSYAFQVKCSVHKPSISHRFDHFKTSLSSTFKPFFMDFPEVPLRIDHVSKTVKTNSVRLLDAFVDLVFEFIDQPLLPSQSNFAPVEETGAAIHVTRIEGMIPDDFPQGVYIRNGPNPLFGGLKSTMSIFGKSSHIWVEGEGMLHALHLNKDSDGNWKVFYKNRHVETETFKLEKQRNKPSFLPAIEGQSPAILSAFFLNLLRFGKVNKDISNTSVFEHGGKFYSIAESHMPHEIDILTLETIGDWHLNGAWNRPFTSHPKREKRAEEFVKMEHHKFEENTFCTGAAFVPKHRGVDEDDGWIISFVHTEDTDKSYVYIIDTKKFCSEPVAKITMPRRVPYGFHGAFISNPLPNLTRF